MKAIPSAATIGLTLTACAYNQQPIVDLTQVSQAQYQQDLAYCERFAESVDKGEAAKVEGANGAAVGAGVGAIVGVFDQGLGGALAGALIGATAGGATGAVEGADQAVQTQEVVLRNCLADKGYKVYDRRV